MWTPFRTRRSSMRSLPQSLTPSALAATILWLSLGPTKAERELSGLTEAPWGLIMTQQPARFNFRCVDMSVQL